jgi:hypothetical protein
MVLLSHKIGSFYFYMYYIIYNKKEYFYVRDIYLNILVIVDEEGQLVVKYN